MSSAGQSNDRCLYLCPNCGHPRYELCSIVSLNLGRCPPNQSSRTVPRIMPQQAAPVCATVPCTANAIDCVPPSDNGQEDAHSLGAEVEADSGGRWSERHHVPPFVCWPCLGERGAHSTGRVLLSLGPSSSAYSSERGVPATTLWPRQPPGQCRVSVGSGDDQDRQGDDGDGQEDRVGEQAGSSGVHVIHRFCRVIAILRSMSRVRRGTTRCSATMLRLLRERQRGREWWSGREDLNLRPLRPERSALPSCATPRPI